MKLFSKIACSLAVLAAVLCKGQEQPLAGFVFANAIGINAPADITANGKKLTKKSLQPGMATSGLGLAVGSYDVEVSAAGCESAKTTLQLTVGATPVLVSYLERVPDTRTNNSKNIIRLRQFPSISQESNYVIQTIVVDLTAQFSAITGGQTQALTNLKPTAFEAKQITIKDSTGSITEAKVDEKGNYYCFVFRKADGKPAYSLVPQRIYRW